MLQPLSGDNNSHAKCRFPARLIWIRKNLQEYEDRFAPIDCPDFAEWSSLNDVESLSIVFANGYLGNPASYYGHIFLKINVRKALGKSYLVDQTLNFGAIDTNRDGPLFYIVKGVTGGYDGGFSAVDFYFHDKNYGELELRDLWEYRLSLPPAEVKYVVSHAWEVMHKKYTYYFFHDNCAFRVAELLEIVEGVEANPRGLPWIIPQAVLQKIHGAAYLGKPLVAGKTFHPSRQTRLYQRYANLGSAQKVVLSEAVDKKIKLDGGALEKFSTEEQQGLLDTLLDYYQFRNDIDTQDGVKKTPPEYVETLSLRLGLPPGEIKKPTHEIVSPDAGHPPSWTQISFGYGEGGRNIQTLRIRPAYYDQLDVRGAQARNGALSMGDLMVELEGSRLRIRHFDLVAIDSINPAVTGLPGDRSVGWKLKAGLEQERLACVNCLAARVQGDYSIGGMLGTSRIFGAVHVGGALQGHYRFDGPGFGRVGASMVYRPSDHFGVKLHHEWRHPFDSNYTTYSTTSTEVRWALKGNYDLRVRWDRDNQHRVSLGVGYYW